MDRAHIVQVGTTLVATLADELDDRAAVTMQEEVADLVVRRRAHGVLLDVSALEIVDSYIAKVLGDTAKIVTVLGAQVAIVGMRPAVAITLVELGLSLDGIAKAASIDAGIAMLTAALAQATAAELDQAARLR
ncbi:STAS domain-containing protein [uncultured Jatrophihabitans sp.]|uniref:STAS domain-containing protein n=1 Tax=uncultured Jatrophihabitans sp. TaxID=1610747 RepID=UPI0035C9C868